MNSGVAGGVVSQLAFEEHFGIVQNGKVNASKDNNLSGNVVSVLQAGAFFGALGSAPLSGECFICFYSLVITITVWITSIIQPHPTFLLL